MHLDLVLLVVSIASGTLAQSSSGDGLGAFLSDAYSVVSQVKSIITETPSSTTRTSASKTSSASSKLVSSTAAASSTPLISSILSSSTQGNVASTTPISTPSSAPSSHHDGVNKLAIILGVIFGLLLLLVIALIAFCCIRRRRRRNHMSRHVLSPDDDEVDRWRGGHHRESLNAGWRPPGATGSYTHISAGGPAATDAPELRDHPAFRNEHDTEMSQPTNPFVPVPPAPRRSAPNSRAGLTDGSRPGQEPFLHRHAGATAAAAGFGGAALGAAAAKRHNNRRKSSSSESPSPPQHGILRKPVRNSDSYEKLDHSPMPEAYFPSQKSPYSTHDHDNYGPYTPSHTRNDSTAATAPLIPGSDPEKHTYNPDHSDLNTDPSAPLPTHYTSDRPATPMGLMAFGSKSNKPRRPSPSAAMAGAGALESSGASTTSQSYDSAHSTTSTTGGILSGALPPRKSASRSPNKKTRFSDSVEEWDGRYSGENSAGESTGTKDSGERLSGSMPGGWGGGNTRGAGGRESWGKSWTETQAE
ncbi:MAG: hypothetical protein Q9160_003633 [Pyrenula sp. 1 TL-2023]